tara:strand:- start:1069 stop:1311 length:243 start_codon:yes stop_codon:yes gene_type:complete
MTTREELVSMKKDISSINGKMDGIDAKLDMLTEKLLNPDTGVTARVNRNTAMRKVLVKAMWVIYGLTIGAIDKNIYKLKK